MSSEGNKVNINARDPSAEFFEKKDFDEAYNFDVLSLACKIEAYPEKEGVYPGGLSYKLVQLTLQHEGPAKKTTKKRKISEPAASESSE